VKWFVGYVCVMFAFWLGFLWGNRRSRRRGLDKIHVTVDPPHLNDHGCISFWRQLEDGSLELLHQEDLPHNEQ
jgi:hypothetical protein